MFGLELRLGGRCLAQSIVLEGGVWLKGASWSAVSGEEGGIWLRDACSRPVFGFELQVCPGMRELVQRCVLEGGFWFRAASWKAIFGVKIRLGGQYLLRLGGRYLA